MDMNVKTKLYVVTNKPKNGLDSVMKEVLVGYTFDEDEATKMWRKALDGLMLSKMDELYSTVINFQDITFAIKI